jgi:TatD-related deoxyribonuclease
MAIFRSVFDNFLHLRRNGYFLDAAEEFRRYGGTSMNIVNFPDYVYSPEMHYNKIYRETIAVAREVAEIGLNTVITLGPYPLDYFFFRSAGKNPLESMKAGIDLAAGLIREGRADAMGEIGFPHFQVDEDVYDDSGKILEYALDICSDYDIPLILHTEDMSPDGYAKIENIIKRHYRVDRVMKHHANSVDLGYPGGILKSLIASRSNVRVALESGKDFLLETDYTDQKEKPGKVIPVYSVPKRCEMIKNSCENYDEIFHRIFEEIPYKFYRKEFFNP